MMSCVQCSINFSEMWKIDQRLQTRSCLSGCETFGVKKQGAGSESERCEIDFRAEGNL